MTRRDHMIPAIVAVSIPDTHFSCTCCASRTTRHRETIEAFFGIDQSTVCRYLQFCNEMLKETLSTLNRISEAMSKCKIVEEIKEFVPGRNAGTLLVDGIHILVHRPGDKEERKKTYTGKKKNHTNNTTIISTTDNIIVGISKTVVRSTHDLKMIKEHSIPFGR